MEPIAVILTVLVVLVVVLLFWLIAAGFSNRARMSAHSALIEQLAQQLQFLKTAQDDTKDKIAQSLQAGQQSISQSLQSSQQILSRLNTQIGELQGTNKQMLQMGTDVRRLQDILASPKMRGQIGEWSLANLLSNILPAENFVLQYGFKDGKIADALIKLADYSVAVDAKFPLPAFEQMLSADSDEQKARLRKQFQNDVTKHIDKIAADYIKPDEGTLDFAFMYIPAENIYYETVVKYQTDTKNVLQYSLDKKVIPVGPNLLYAYLMTVVMGLRGLAIEKQARQIYQNLKKLQSFFDDFADSWVVLGSHLRNAYSKYDEGQKKLDRFGMQLTQIQGEKTPGETGG
jgi:DNA recombination protein RmuC